MKTRKNTLLACVGALILGSGCGIATAGTVARDHGKDYSKTPMQPVDACGPWFSGLSAGIWWVQDYNVTVPYSPLTGDHTASFDTGFQINVTPIGYRFSDMCSLSLELGFYQADADSVTVPGGLTFTATDGQLRLFPVMVNTTVTIPVANHVSLYAGFGAGILYRELEATVPAGGPLAFYHDSGWNATLQARAGVSIEVGRCQFVNVGYRYNHVFANPDDISGHSVEAGYTFVW